ncbi:YycH family regulatory protein [Neobacillus dielmonensis]|uniref:YycH family regulatory protein n=1 Tax=Neobacillus dielmonensis TaxID=1347369 RepID=UPI0005A684C3|nr:two-component system activity regulator YycH [Neobacillus dielmonensis]
MSYENSKSIILTILVLISVFLTWNLWTYHPNYEKLENSNVVPGVTLSQKQEVQTIIKPDMVIYHTNGGYFGTNNAKDLDTMIKEMSKWSFFEVENYTEEAGNIKELINGDGKAEIVFPDDVPIEIYRNVLKLEGKKVPSFNFDRIVIDAKDSDSDNGEVYFVSTEAQQVYISHISPANLAEFKKDFYKEAASQPRYFAYEPSASRTIYLPDGETKMNTFKYFPKILDSEELKEALFSDPNYVQKSTVPPYEEYTNNSSKLSINLDTNIVTYINPTTEEKYVENSYDLVNRSIGFVNEHGGWTDPYRFVSKDEFNRSVTFRLYTSDGYPVFNGRGLSEITEVWGRNEITSYTRPNIALELPLTTEMQMVTQPSGHEVLSYLQNKKNFKSELLEQLVLGYKMERETEENRLILLEPAWFYRYNGSWGHITMEELGGPEHGLE